MGSRVSAGTARAASVLLLAGALALSGTIAGQAGVRQAGVRQAGVRQAPAGRAALRQAAAGPGGWPLAVSLHYGRPQNASGYSVIVAPGRSDAWAFGGTNPGGSSQPVALQWNGTRWRFSPLPRGLSGFIGDASAPSGRDVWAVSYSGGYILHWNGTRWSVGKRWRHHAVLTGVTALGPADVWAFGTTTAGVSGMGTWHFDGRAWSRVRGPGREIYRASAVSARDIWAVAATRRGGFVEHYNGRSWRSVRTLPALGRASLDDVLAVSRHDVWLVGNLRAHDEGRLVVAHFDGRRWTKTLTPWHADTGRLASDGSGGVWITADTTGADTHALIGRLSRGGRQSWTTLRHGLGSGVSDISTARGTTRVWLSGGFLTRDGGDAAIWSHGSSRPSRDGDRQILGTGHSRAASAIRPGYRLLVFRSWHLNLAALLLWHTHQSSSPPRAARTDAAT
jgi:hypothetical protein